MSETSLEGDELTIEAIKEKIQGGGRFVMIAYKDTTRKAEYIELQNGLPALGVSGKVLSLKEAVSIQFLS